MATDDRTPKTPKTNTDKQDDKVDDLQSPSGKEKDEQVKGGRMRADPLI